MSSNDVKTPTRSAIQGTMLTSDFCSVSIPCTRNSASEPLGDDVSDLEVVTAIDHDGRPSGAEYTGQAAGIVGAARQPEPPHVHRGAEAARHQAHRRASID